MEEVSKGRGRFVAALGVVLCGLAASCRSPEGVRVLGGRAVAEDVGIEPALSADLALGPGRVRAFVRFDRALQLEEHGELHKRNVRLLEHLGRDTFVVSLPTPIDLETFELAPLVRWAGSIRSEDKLHPLLRCELAGMDPDARVSARACFFADVETAEAAAELIGLQITGTKVGAGPIFSVSITRAELAALMASPLVASMEPAPPRPVPLNDKGRAAANTDLAQGFQPPALGASSPTYAGVSGLGVKIGICDWGVDETHLDLAHAASSTTRVVPPNPAWNSDHGTAVASIAAGNGWNSAAQGYPPDFSLRGHAPEALLGDYGQIRDDEAAYELAIGTDGVDLTQHSYQQGNGPWYTSAHAGIDAIVRGFSLSGVAIPSQPSVWAAGNNGLVAEFGVHEGFYSVLAAAKNSICVGSVDTKDSQVSEFSSLGPTLDGRIKPDLVAPGAHEVRPGTADGIRAAHRNTLEYTQDYEQVVGTSCAAPVVSGIIALMMQRVVDQGIGTPASLWASTYKAILVQTARDRVRPFPASDLSLNPDTEVRLAYHEGPDFASGFGLVDGAAAVALAGDLTRWTSGTLAAANEVHSSCFHVASSADPLRVTLAWDDLPSATYWDGTPGGSLAELTTDKLTNDLDLRLIDPGGNEHLPWVLDPLALATDVNGNPDPLGGGKDGPSGGAAAQPGIDTRNNVEVVDVQSPTPGTWQLEVRASSLPTNVPQPYSLASSQPLWTLCLDLPSISGFVDLCVRFPWACEAVERWRPDFDIVTGLWLWNPDSILPIVEILRREGLVDPGVRYGFEDPPDLVLEVAGLPSSAQLVVFDAEGAIHACVPAAEMRVPIPVRSAGQRFFLVIAGEDGEPLSESTNLMIQVEQSKDRSE